MIEEHRDQVMQLVARLEAEETLDLDAIKSCLGPDYHNHTLCEEAETRREVISSRDGSK